MQVSFSSLGKFSAIISSSQYSALFSLSSSEKLIMQILICLILYKMYLKLASLYLFIYFFSFCCSDHVSSIDLSLSSPVLPSASSTFCFI